MLFGKASTTFTKHSTNHKIEPWCCMSLVMQSRSLDLYLREDQVNRWFVALSAEVKRCNPNAFVISMGRFYWRKMFLLMSDIFLKQTALHFGFPMYFWKAVLCYGQEMQRREMMGQQ